MSKVFLLLCLTIFALSAESAEVSAQDVSYSQNYEDSLESELKLAQLQNDDGEPDDEEIADEQIWSLVAKHAGRAMCKYLRRKPRVLEQNIHTWLQNEVAAIEKYDEQKAIMQWKWFRRASRKVRRVTRSVRNVVKRAYKKVRSRVVRRARGWYKKIKRRIGSGVKRLYSRVRRRIGGRFKRWYGRIKRGVSKVRGKSRKWFRGIRRKAGKWYRILKSRAGKFGGMVKKFVRRAGKIGRKVCNLVYGKCKEAQE